jgi:hypothetical protein
MGLALKVNFKKGWPNPSVLEAVAPPHTGVTALEAGMVGYKNASTGGWVLGITAITQVPYIFRNDQTDPDAARGPGVGNSTTTNFSDTWNQVSFGGVQGIALSNPLEVQTVQFTGSPAVGDELTAAASGKLATAIATNVVVGICTKASHTYQGKTYITFVPTPVRVK